MPEPIVAALPVLLLIALVWYVLISSWTLLVYGWDKRAAMRGRQPRVPERRLHGLALLGGFPGALLGQQLFRHKRRKPGFMLRTGAIVLMHAALWIALGWVWWSLRASA